MVQKQMTEEIKKKLRLMSSEVVNNPLYELRPIYAWLDVGGGGGPLWAPRSWTRAPPVPPPSRASARGRRHRRGTGPRTWGPQRTPTDPPPPPHSSQAYMGSSFQALTVGTKGSGRSTVEAEFPSESALATVPGTSAPTVANLSVAHLRSIAPFPTTPTNFATQENRKLSPKPTD